MKSNDRYNYNKLNSFYKRKKYYKIEDLNDTFKDILIDLDIDIEEETTGKNRKNPGRNYSINNPINNSIKMYDTDSIQVDVLAFVGVSLYLLLWFLVGIMG